jgi:hypothetical protein
MRKFISNPAVNVDPVAETPVAENAFSAPVAEEKVVRAVAPVEKVRVAPKPRAACPKKPAAAAPMAQVPEESVVPPVAKAAPAAPAAPAAVVAPVKKV